MDKALPLKVKIRPIRKSCLGCVHRGQDICSLCVTLCEDEAGQRYVSVKPLEGNGRWRWRKIEDLSKPPNLLRRE